jgi:putative FmdB family regulatory protein
MPIFDYKCESCGEVFEKVWIGSKEGIAVCPKCESADTKKQPSATKNLRLYGKGFYKQSHKDSGDWS